jgi:hypothetical protein
MIEGVNSQNRPRDAENDAGHGHPAPARAAALVQAVLTYPILSAGGRETRQCHQAVKTRARAEQRQRLFSVFFIHQPGDMRQKIRQAYAVIDAVTDPGEHTSLRALLRTLQSIADACPRREDEGS